MSRVDAARESRKGATVILTHLIKMKKFFKERLFCLFEGDDSKYYTPRIAAITGYSQEALSSFTCGGKKEVIRLLGLVENSPDLHEAKTVYFIDKDFDEPLDGTLSEKIYETTCYSIENLYTRPISFARILKCEFMYNEAYSEYEVILDIYRKRQEEFHQSIILFNAWIACQREYYNLNPKTSEKVNLGGFALSNFIKNIDLDEVVSDYNLDKIHESFKRAPIINESVLSDKVKAFTAHADKGNLFRGKFEIYFLRKFIESLLKELRLETSRFFKMPGLHLSVSNDNIISELSQYAETPENLKDYLMQRLAA